jgi:hypothetical protein
MAARFGQVWRWFAAALVLLVLNYAWELAHARLFTNYADVPRPDHVLDCLRHAFTDLLIAVGTYLATGVIFRSVVWACSPRWRWAALVWVVLGLIVTVGIEMWATSTGRWGYTAAMPTVFGIGLTPILQWIVVPVAALLMARRFLPSPASVGG